MSEMALQTANILYERVYKSKDFCLEYSFDRGLSLLV